MKQKIIFIDIDGTLVHFNEGREYIPESAKEAIIRARYNGHLVFLCTGRSKSEVYDYVLQLGFDGVIGAAGGFIQVGQNEIFHRTIESKAAAHAIDFFNEHGVDFYLECNNGLFASEHLPEHLEQLIFGDIQNDEEARARKEAGHPFLDAMITGKNLYQQDINKISFIATNGYNYENVRKEFEDEFDVDSCTVEQFGEDSGELSVKGVNKSTAIHFLMDALGKDMKDTIAIGDGLNDMEMVQCVEIGIAMGNAKEELKAIADFVTAGITEDGILRAFEHFRII